MKIPYGLYLNEDNEICFDPEKREAINMMYDMYIEGFSLRKIAEALKVNGYLSPTGKTDWTPQSIDNVMHNSKYIPIVTFEKYVEACFAREVR